ncbi:MAG: glutaminase [Planctomycetes bacterium]|nr:glutaminase [Planctomycetota bacterium]
MERFEINGGTRLKGTVEINGAKNAALPIMAACILCESETILHNVPDVADVRQMAALLGRLGVKAEQIEPGQWKLKVEDELNCHAEYELVSKMRASICVMGPLLAKRHRAQVSMPGGCAIGDRPVGLHTQGLAAMGADVDLVNGDMVLKAKKLRAVEMFLGGPFGSSVTATANIMMAATLANNGIHPETGERVVSEEAARRTLSVMATCGMYDGSGRWLARIGIPAKSGVSGGIIGVLPGQVGLASFAPRLDDEGNSVQGVEMFAQLCADLGLHLMASERRDVAQWLEKLSSRCGCAPIKIGHLSPSVSTEIPSWRGSP